MAQSEKKQEQIILIGAAVVIGFLLWKKFKAAKALKASQETPGAITTNAGGSSSSAKPLFFDVANAQEVQLTPFPSANDNLTTC